MLMLLDIRAQNRSRSCYLIPAQASYGLPSSKFERLWERTSPPHVTCTPNFVPGLLQGGHWSLNSWKLFENRLGWFKYLKVLENRLGWFKYLKVLENPGLRARVLEKSLNIENPPGGPCKVLEFLTVPVWNLKSSGWPLVLEFLKTPWKTEFQFLKTPWEMAKMVLESTWKRSSEIRGHPVLGTTGAHWGIQLRYRDHGSTNWSACTCWWWREW